MFKLTLISSFYFIKDRHVPCLAVTVGAPDLFVDRKSLFVLLAFQLNLWRKKRE